MCHVFYFMITMSLMCKQQAALSDELTTAHTSTVTSHTVTVDGHSQRRAGPQSGTFSCQRQMFPSVNGGDRKGP